MTGLTTAPVLSTPETAIFEDPTPELKQDAPKFSDAEVLEVYEVERTAREIKAGGWKRMALQFPDQMLRDAPRVYEFLQQALDNLPELPKTIPSIETTTDSKVATVTENLNELDLTTKPTPTPSSQKEKLFILGDTSYGACCVDEIAAEHCDAEVVVHYGRSCLSPTARLPVIYVFTTHPLDPEPMLQCFESTFSEKDTKVVLMADVTYNDHLSSIAERVRAAGYTNVFVPEIIHNPSSLLPNRTVPPSVEEGSESLSDYSLFHISDPPQSLLLTLSSRMAAMYIYPTGTPSSSSAVRANTTRTLSRRYATLTSLSTCPIFGILINTLSVKNYLPTISAIQKQIADAGKKSYTFVVGKVNAAKVANFSEIGGWVVVGCWESSLLESDEFYRPIITPYELGLCLQSDDDRVWTGEWRGDFADILSKVAQEKKPQPQEDIIQQSANGGDSQGQDDEDYDSEEDSAPPEFDLRTGRYISHTRPMRAPKTLQSRSPQPSPLPTEQWSSNGPGPAPSNALLKRVTGEIASINGQASPGAEYLRSQRTWTGLGSDFEIRYDEEEDGRGAVVEEGRAGVARGYTVGEEGEKH
jgi:diphthamide biosynthesis protein 2